MPSRAVAKIAGISDAHAVRLAAAGVRTAAEFLERSADPAGRTALAEVVGVDPDEIARWANRADLMRIRGVGRDYCELLDAAGIATAGDLATFRPNVLVMRLAAVNASHGVVRQLPNIRAVRDWIEQAKELPSLERA